MSQFDDRPDSVAEAGGEFEGADERVEQAERYEPSSRLDGRIDSVDVGSFVSGVEKLLSYHLASRGLK